jgi:FtsP/CotA-like multicopper oxidase with cupredoxin domain
MAELPTVGARSIRCTQRVRQMTTSWLDFFSGLAVPFTVPPSPGTGGNEYRVHCHILEPEEHDMTRPLIVT